MSLSHPNPFRTKHIGKNKVYQKKGPSLDDIFKDICDVFGKSVDEIKTTSRRNGIIVCKRIYCYVSCIITDATLREIGDLYGTDHTTVMYHRHSVIQMKSVNDPYFMESWQNYISNSKIWNQYVNQQTIDRKRVA